MLALEMIGNRFHLGGVGAAGVQEGAAGAIDGPGDEAVEGQDVAALALRVVEVEMGQALPAAANADDFAVEFGGAVGDFLDHRVKTRDVAAASEDSNSFGHGYSWRGSRKRVRFQYIHSDSSSGKAGGGATER